MKDFFDLWFLSETFAFDGRTLSAAMHATFTRRRTPIPETIPLALTPVFSTDATKAIQWRAFVKRGHLGPAGLELATVVDHLAPFLWPPLDAARRGAEFRRDWSPKGPAWKTPTASADRP